MLRTLRSCCTLALAVLVTTPALANTALSFTFSGLGNNEQPLGYYMGGYGSLGSGPGPNYGITFSPNSSVITAAHGNLLTANGTIVMDIGPEFANSLKFGYVAAAPEVVDVWSGYDGTGYLLATRTLTPNSWCQTLNCGWAHAAEGFSGAAASVTFSGGNSLFGLGAVKLGTPIWTKPAAPAGAMAMTRMAVVTPEPSAFALAVTGFAGLLLIQWFRKKKILLHLRMNR